MNVMVDLETRGFTPGCALLSIGAVGFDHHRGQLWDDGFYVAVKSNEKAMDMERSQCGLFEQQSTMDWWADQSEEARKVFTDPKAVELPEALEMLNDYLRSLSGEPIVWGNGADFDNAILAAAYHAAEVKPGWKPYNGRCYRTLKNLFPNVRMPKRQGTHHNALDDARSQAMHAMELLQYHDRYAPRAPV